VFFTHAGMRVSFHIAQVFTDRLKTNEM
jgi:hypothetical protein